MTSDTPRTDERWETVERFMIAAFPTTLPGWQDTDAALKALRRQLEQTERERDTLREERNLALAYGKQVENERDAYKTDRTEAQLEQTERDYAAFRQAVDGKIADWPEKLDRIAARLEQTKKERDAALAALRKHHDDITEWRKANDKALDLPCGICGRALTTQEDR